MAWDKRGGWVRKGRGWGKWRLGGVCNKGMGAEGV